MGGQDKGLISLNGQPLFEHIMSKLAPQVGNVAIIANRNIEIYQSVVANVLSDTLPDYPGPLAGMLSAMQHLSGEWFLFCPCDTPNIPEDLAYKLWVQKEESCAVWVNDGDCEFCRRLKVYPREASTDTLSFSKPASTESCGYRNGAQCIRETVRQAAQRDALLS